MKGWHFSMKFWMKKIVQKYLNQKLKREKDLKAWHVWVKIKIRIEGEGEERKMWLSNVTLDKSRVPFPDHKPILSKKNLMRLMHNTKSLRT